MKSLKHPLAIALIAMTLWSTTMVAQAIEQTLDEIGISLIQTKLKDCCGNELTEKDIPNQDLATKERLQFPPDVSECCAYDNTPLVADVDKDQVSIVYTTLPELKTLGLTARLVIRDEDKQIVYEKEVDPSSAQTKYKETIWPLTTTAGAPLNVGRQGKRYISTIEITKGNLVESTSGAMPIFVDDCDARQQAIRDLKNDPNVFQDEGFHWYLELEDAVATEICKRIKNGVVRQQGPSDGFSNRCHYQCINNLFTNLIVDFSLQPIDANNVWANAHRRTIWYRKNIGVLDPVLNSMPYFGSINSNVEAMEILVIYVLAENYLRAEGYFQCDSPLNSRDRELSISLISEVINKYLNGKGFPFDAVSGFTGDVAEWLGKEMVVKYHLDKTDEHYTDRKNGNQIVEGIYPP